MESPNPREACSAGSRYADRPQSVHGDVNRCPRAKQLDFPPNPETLEQPLDHEKETQDNDEQHVGEAPFMPVPPESDEQPLNPDDDSDAPIRLDELAPDEPVRAENVTVSQGSAQSIEASNVSITQGAAAQVSAEQVTVRQGALALTRAENVTVEAESSAFAVYAENATVEQGGNVFILLTRSLTGEVRPVLDWRAALALGGGFALVLSILRRIR